MADVNKTVQVDLVAKDEMSRVLNHVKSEAREFSTELGHIGRHLMSWSGLGMAAGAIFGGIELHEQVKEAGEYFQTIQRIRTITGESAEASSGLFSAMRRVGMEGSEAERVLIGMSRRAAMLSLQGEEVVGHVSRQRLLYQQLGIDIRKGPVENIMALSRAVKAGRADLGTIGAALGVRGTALVSFQRLLQRGPEGIQQIVQHARHLGLVVGADVLGNYQRVVEAEREMKETWEGIRTTIATNLLPVAASWLSAINDHMGEWVDKAKEVGEWLQEHQDTFKQIGSAIGDVIGLVGDLTAATFRWLESAGQGVSTWKNIFHRFDWRHPIDSVRDAMQESTDYFQEMQRQQDRAREERAFEAVPFEQWGVMERSVSAAGEVLGRRIGHGAANAIATEMWTQFGPQSMEMLSHGELPPGILDLIRGAGTAITTEPPGTRPGPPVFDFRNSTFEVTNNFDKEANADRIAVGLFSSIASLAERRRMSVAGGLPAGTVR